MELIRDTLVTEGRDVTVEIRPCDLADAGARGVLIGELEGRDVNIIVNSAGVATFGEFRKLDPAYERTQFELNATAVFELTAAVLPGMGTPGSSTSAPSPATPQSRTTRPTWVQRPWSTPSPRRCTTS